MSSSAPVPLAFSFAQPRNEAEEKAPVIFLHGMTVSKESWHTIPQTVAHETGRKVYSVDFRHHGDSPWSETFEFDHNVLDLSHFMTTHKIPKAVLVGHSMGGMTAIKFALTMPEKVEKLVVEDATIGRIPKEVIQLLIFKLSLSRKAMMSMPKEADEVEAVDWLLNSVKSSLPPAVRELAQFDRDSFVLRKSGGRYEFKANIDALESALRELPGTLPELEGLYRGPSCFIYGKLSPFDVGSDADAIRQLFPSAELVGVPNAGHTVHNDCRTEFLEVLFAFLRDGDGQ